VGNYPLTTAVAAIAKEIKNTNDQEFTLHKDEVIKDLGLEIKDRPSPPTGNEGRTWTKMIVSTKLSDHAFVMVPAIALRQSEVRSDKSKTLNNEPDRVREVLQDNPEILFDFYVARKIDDQLGLMGNLNSQPLKIVQAYFISESGVILLRHFPNNESYEQDFPTNTLFNDRLYFWGAIDIPGFRNYKTGKGPLDYATDPYVDLGGNGVVKTLSQRVDLPNNRNGVICVDVALPEPEKEIQIRLRALGADVEQRTVTLEKSPVATSETSAKKPKVTFSRELPEDFGWVKTELESEHKPNSRITGAIAFESDGKDSSTPPNDDEVVRFTVPMGNARGGADTKLLLVTFDFRASRNWIRAYSAGFALGTGLFLLFAATVAVRVSWLDRQMKRVLQNMSKVMYNAATPFVWLDENNRFVEVNISFLHAVGCDNVHELKALAETFKELLTAESRPDYEEILAQSARGLETPAYNIVIKTRDNRKVVVRVHGERIPYENLALGKKRAAHRFGVFLTQPVEIGTANGHISSGEKRNPAQLNP
jgi:hypothetical protein